MHLYMHTLFNLIGVEQAQALGTHDQQLGEHMMCMSQHNK